MPAITDELAAYYYMPVWPGNGSVVRRLLYLIGSICFMAAFLIGVRIVPLMILNSVSLVALFAAYLGRKTMETAVYALMSKSLQLFILNSLRGAMIHKTGDQVKVLLELVPFLGPHASHITSLAQAFVGALPDYFVLKKAAKVAFDSKPALSGIAVEAPKMRGFMTSDTFHGLLRDSAWSAPMFYFVVNPALHMVVSYLGSLIRKARGKKHEDTQDMCEYAIFFIASALVSTFVFATGSHFVASFPAVAPAPSDDHVKKSRDVHPEEQVDGRIVSGLQVMAGSLVATLVLCCLCWILMSFNNSTTHQSDAVHGHDVAPVDSVEPAAHSDVAAESEATTTDDTAEAPAPALPSDTVARTQAEPADDTTRDQVGAIINVGQEQAKPLHDTASAKGFAGVLASYFSHQLHNTVPALEARFIVSKWRNDISVALFCLSLVIVGLLSWGAGKFSFENLQNMDKYVNEQNWTESFLGLWLLPLQDRLPEALVSLTTAFHDHAHGNVWDGLASTALSGMAFLGMVLPVIVLPMIDDLKPTFVASPTFANVLFTSVLVTVILVRCPRSQWFLTVLLLVPPAQLMGNSWYSPQEHEAKHGDGHKPSVQTSSLGSAYPHMTATHERRDISTSLDTLYPGAMNVGMFANGPDNVVRYLPPLSATSVITMSPVYPVDSITSRTTFIKTGTTTTGAMLAGIHVDGLYHTFADPLPIELVQSTKGYYPAEQATASTISRPADVTPPPLTATPAMPTLHRLTTVGAEGSFTTRRGGHGIFLPADPTRFPIQLPTKGTLPIPVSTTTNTFHMRGRPTNVNINGISTTLRLLNEIDVEGTWYKMEPVVYVDEAFKGGRDVNPADIAVRAGDHMETAKQDAFEEVAGDKVEYEVVETSVACILTYPTSSDRTVTSPVWPWNEE